MGDGSARIRGPVRRRPPPFGVQRDGDRWKLDGAGGTLAKASRQTEGRFQAAFSLGGCKKRRLASTATRGLGVWYDSQREVLVNDIAAQAATFHFVLFDAKRIRS